jgi:hypothetical protein
MDTDKHGLRQGLEKSSTQYDAQESATSFFSIRVHPWLKSSIKKIGD